MEACAKLQRRFRPVGLKQLALPAGLGAAVVRHRGSMVLATAWDLACIDGPTSKAEAALRLLVGTPGALPGVDPRRLWQRERARPVRSAAELALCFAPAELCVERPRRRCHLGAGCGKGMRPSAPPPPPAGGKAAAAAGAGCGRGGAPSRGASRRLALAPRGARERRAARHTPPPRIGRAAAAARRLTVSLQPPQGGRLGALRRRRRGWIGVDLATAAFADRRWAGRSD